MPISTHFFRFILVGTILLAGSAAQAVDISGNYEIDANTSDALVLNSGWRIISNSGAPTASGTVTQNAYGEFAIGTGNTLTFNFPEISALGFLKSGVGNLTLSASSGLRLNGTVANPATVDVTDGILTVNELRPGFDANSYGIVNISGGKVVVNTETEFGNTDSSTSLINISDNGAIEFKGVTRVANATNSNATINMNGRATLSAQYTSLGQRGNATLNMADHSIASFTTLEIGSPSAATNVGAMNLSGNASATVRGTASTIVGYQSVGRIRLADNSSLHIDVTSGSGYLLLGGVGSGHTAAAGYVTVADNATLTLDTGGPMIVGQYGFGSLTQSGGTITLNQHGTYNGINAGNLGGIGVLNFSGGTLNINGNGTNAPGINLGQRSIGRMNVSGDAFVNIRNAKNPNGSLVVSAGAEAGGRGIVYQSGGTVNTNAVVLGNGSSTKAEYYLSGGTLNANTIQPGGASSCERIFDMTGGTLNVGAITLPINQTGGSLAPGGNGDLGMTTINAAYTLGSSAGGLSDINIALAGTGTVSSVFSGYPAGRAFDGTTVTGSNNFAYTGDGENQWVQVDLGGDHTIGQVKVWNRSGFGPGDTNNRLTAGDGYYFALYDDPDATLDEYVWRSDSTKSYTAGGVLDFTDPWNTKGMGTGRYLRLVRDYDKGDSDWNLVQSSLNLTELQVFELQDASEGRIRLEIDARDTDPANWDIDKLVFGASGSLDLGAGAILELAFLGDVGGVDDWQIFDPAVFTDGTITGTFSEIVLSTPYWAFTQESLDAFYSTGMLSTYEVPEPATWLILLLGVLGVAATGRRKGERE